MTVAGPQIAVLVTTPRLPAGLLTAAAWDALRAARTVFVGDPAHPLLPHLDAAGVAATVLDLPPAAAAGEVLTAAGSGPVLWVAAPDGDEALARALGERLTATGGALEVVHGSWDPPGARLLDVVQVMDRLRSPGGCPWDAEQTHASLAKYLLEEAYEAVELIETERFDELAEEMGDVLLQVAFHARVASERDDGTGWDIDDVAAGLVDKLVGRHPHVFAGHTVDGADEVVANWEVLKAAEKGRTSVTEGVPVTQPALSLANKLLSRAGRAGLPPSVVDPLLAGEAPAQALRAVLTDVPTAAERDADDAAVDPVAQDYVGRVLLLAVALARGLSVNPEAALRAASRAYRERLLAAEAADGGDAHGGGSAAGRDSAAGQDSAGGR